jgi:NhaP-type Na+/H+ or K+/H+ antiporter
VLGLAVCAYACSLAVHGNGFIAVFIGGLAFGTTGGRRGEPLALVAWFGPRGLASVVFCLLALEELGSPAADHAAAVITITVVLSVIAHGATADPPASRYARHLARRLRTCGFPI